MVVLPDTWRCGVSARTWWPCVSILSQDEIAVWKKTSQRRKSEKENDSVRGWERVRQTDRQIDRDGDRQAKRQTVSKTDRNRDQTRGRERQTVWWTNSRTESSRQTDRRRQVILECKGYIFVKRTGNRGEWLLDRSEVGRGWRKCPAMKRQT